jgi:signal transduction histidine kinase
MGSVSAGVLLTYATLNAILPPGEIPMVAAVRSLFFLGGACLLAFFATSAGHERRRRDLALRLELEGANRDLKALDEAKTRFFANVSHELRTPLALILGPLDEMLEDTQDARARPRLESIRANARRLLRQVNAILDATKIEAGRLELDLTQANLGEVAASLVNAAVPHARSQSVELASEGLDDIPDSLLDVEKVEVVIANLISNAIKFTPEGGRIVVRAHADESSVHLEVADTGCGIPEAELERVFERFFQVDSAASRQHEGTGLGLAVTEELVAIHQGKVAVASVPGEGSTFSVVLPRDPPVPDGRRRTPRRREDRWAATRLAELATEPRYMERNASFLLADVAASADPGPDRSYQTPPGAARVLVIEDNPEMRRFVARVLSELYRVETAGDGAEGLEAVRRRPPDLVLADVMMPHLDGYELCRAMAEDPTLARIPVVLLTARVGPEAVAEGLEAGAVDHLGKPFAVSELKARVAAHLRARQLEDQLVERDSRLAAVGGMTASILHDLKNPLQSIMLLAELGAERHEPADVARREFEDIADEARRIHRMLVEVLDLTRRGGPPIAPRPTHVAEFAERVFSRQKRNFEHANIMVEVDVGSAVGVAEFDADRMFRVLENLMRNARTALLEQPPEKPRVHLCARLSDSEVVFRVADNGPGIPEDLTATLFEPFVSASKQGGTGLGLATVRNLARAHCGEVEVESPAPEGGAAFTVRLPRTIVANGAERCGEAERAVACERAPRAPLGRPTA